MAMITTPCSSQSVFCFATQVLGRLAAHLSTVLQGKDKPTYCPNLDNGDVVVVVNAEKINLTGNKHKNKFYTWHTG